MELELEPRYSEVAVGAPGGILTTGLNGHPTPVPLHLKQALEGHLRLASFVVRVFMLMVLLIYGR